MKTSEMGSWMLLLVFMATSSSIASEIPQHRIRSSNRHLEYDIESHPWLKVSDNQTKSAHPASNRVNRKRHLDEIRLDNSHLIEEEFLPMSKIKMWSVSSDRNVHENDSDDGFQNIRIRVSLLDHITSGGPFLEEQERTQLMDHLINPAVDIWSKALYVPPLIGNLTIDQQQLFDGSTCGPGSNSGHPSVHVPLEHFNEGVNNTDLQVYLSVGFTKDLANLIQNKFSAMQDNSVSSSNATAPVVTPQSESLAVPVCDGSYVAASTFCSTDQWDRPVAGMLHLCLTENFFEPQLSQINLGIVAHELGHILGFNSQSMAHFRDRETGEPLTPRDMNDDVIDVAIECSGVSDASRMATIPLPSAKILQFHTVRGVRAAHIVTPFVRQVVRNHFDCQDLIGAELESFSYRVEQTSSEDFYDSCISDHWERRLFKYDIMNPIIDDGSVSSLPRISALTLAYFADSGWYKVDLSRIGEPDIWGRGAGCDFVNKQCINEDGSLSWTNSQYFCNSDSGESICTKDIRGKGHCSLSSYDYLPFEFNYFGHDNSFIAGNDALLDYCPIVESQKEGDCTVKPSNHFRMEEFTTSSKCVLGKVHDKPTPLCTPIACNLEDKTLHIRVDGIWTQCLHDDQLVLSWFDDENYAFCPKIRTACPSFVCPGDCFQGESVGVCDFASGKCFCPSLIVEEESSHEVITPCNSTNFISDEDLIQLSRVYMTDASLLIDDDKGLLDATLRMFIQMDVGEVIGFVASSLLAIGSVTMLIFGVVRFVRIKHGRILNLQDIWRRDWRVDTISNGAQLDSNRQSNKDKMVASVLHNMRVETSRNTDISHDERLEYVDSVEGGGDDGGRVFERSEIPALPHSSAGRVISVIGATFLNNSLDLREEEDSDTVVETTETITSVGQMQSDIENASVAPSTRRRNISHSQRM